MQSPGSPDSPTTCEVCSQLQASYLLRRCLPAFKDAKYGSKFGEESYSTTLGTTTQISGRSPFLSFCALILHTLSLDLPRSESTSHADEPESNEVTLKWKFSSNGFLGFRIEDSSGRSGLLRPAETLQEMLEYDFMARYSPFVGQRFLCEAVQLESPRHRRQTLPLLTLRQMRQIQNSKRVYMECLPPLKILQEPNTLPP